MRNIGSGKVEKKISPEEWKRMQEECSKIMDDALTEWQEKCARSLYGKTDYERELSRTQERSVSHGDLVDWKCTFALELSKYKYVCALSQYRHVTCEGKERERACCPMWVGK